MKLIIASLLFWGLNAFANAPSIRGFNLVDNDSIKFDSAATPTDPKTPAQIAVDHAKRLGANHVILNVRAIMKGGHGNEIIPMTPPADRGNELKRMVRLAKYIKSLGMTVGIRPIFFVFGPNGEFPYFEKLSDGTSKLWWHGNIQPQDPNRWFESFRVFLDVYLTFAKAAKIEEFTVGAELYSMTVGVEDQWTEYPYGFPGRWLELLRYVRKILPNARLMYDINFTDDSVNSGGLSASGGELERWRYRIVDLADRMEPSERKIWEDLTNFWKELDAIGIDMYRSLASANQIFPKDFETLTQKLKERTDSFATQMDNTLTQISLAVDMDKPMIFKEVGFRSVEAGFIDPFAYAGSGTVNIVHQASAMRALLESFWDPQWPWFAGVNFWEISLSPELVGPNDNGFSPVGKELSESIIFNYYRRP
ncbi:MAG: hypothetical protein A2622_13240 [Bdellovibrionales bacterium RIFCSPHIGHO2_01_FULL_40_29]|nr:MAG: hypothetical protein A2622_13240 [Bdellovibrionales bacterium RIFCSPHIGHO2_01_FULL_40_29]OFZ33347.1 MAG: hypothetical protein A3D17_13645 [Bdellovibrionales bacterium RIFCSPHIGHO2_02_FULL_40_15]